MQHSIYPRCHVCRLVDVGWGDGRERYRKASEMSRVRGKMTALVINDIDAGVGHFKQTQTTVNNQVRPFVP